MRISYTIYHALSELKRQILALEKETKAEKTKYGKLNKLNSMEWLFERGISLIENTNPDEKADLLDFFQDKSRLRKDIADEKNRLEEIFFNNTPNKSRNRLKSNNKSNKQTIKQTINKTIKQIKQTIKQTL